MTKRWLALVALVGCQDPSVPVTECPRCPPVQAAEPCPEPAKPPPDAAINQPRTELVRFTERGAYLLMRADATTVYLVAPHVGSGELSRIATMPVAGGSLTEIAQVPGQVQEAIVQGESIVVSSELANEYAIRRVTKTGEVTQLVALPKDQWIDGLVIDGESIYYSVWRDDRKHEIRLIANEKDTLVSARRITMNPDEPVVDAAAALAVDASRIYWAYGDLAWTHIFTFDKAKPTGKYATNDWACRRFTSLQVVSERVFVACDNEVNAFTAQPMDGTTLLHSWVHRFFARADLHVGDKLAVLTSSVGSLDWVLDNGDQGIVATVDPASDAVPTILARDVSPYDALVHSTGVLVLTPDAVVRFAR